VADDITGLLHYEMIEDVDEAHWDPYIFRLSLQVSELRDETACASAALDFAMRKKPLNRKRVWNWSRQF